MVRKYGQKFDHDSNLCESKQIFAKLFEQRNTARPCKTLGQEFNGQNMRL